jgi:hypothetical protein
MKNIRMLKNIPNTILTVPETPTVTLGSLEAVIVAIDPEAEFCIIKVNSSHFLTLDIAMEKVECNIKPYFNYPEKDGKV